MKICRGPRTTRKGTVTDAKSLKDWAKDWKPSKQLLLDGTIQKTGQRHTDLWVMFEAEDIAALHDAFQRHQRDRITELEAREAKLVDTVQLLESALGKIATLVSEHKDKAPDDHALLQAVKKIAQHFRSSFRRRLPIDLGWIKFKNL
ncbi:MAG TPA: hypothetical protein VGM54_02005 [Chthoniobacter sp.]|jgi:hypothetical protein